MNKEKILDKIKKCLALSKSANEHEAAQALKQAQALMEKYEVNAVDIALSEVSEQGADQRMAVKLAEWQWAVANMISEVFGCKCYQQGDAMVFYGLGVRSWRICHSFAEILTLLKISAVPNKLQFRNENKSDDTMPSRKGNRCLHSWALAGVMCSFSI